MSTLNSISKPVSKSKMLDSHIGNTPTIKLANIVEPSMSELWVKLEGHNPAGSIKDRTAWGLISDAEERGVLTPGSGQHIVEPTSGNTGIGLAFISAIRGYKCTIVLPDTMSEERIRTLKAYGAELVFTPGLERMQGAIPKAQEIAEETGAWMPNQFENAANPAYHFKVTGPEIWNQMQGRIDAFVWASGTGGSISGVGNYLKKQNSKIKVYAVEPASSAVINGHERGQHKFQGMGPGFIPKNLDVGMLDGAIMVSEDDAFPLARKLAREEGMFLGMSSAATVWAAMKVAKEMGKGKSVVCLTADTGARYMSTELFAED